MALSCVSVALSVMYVLELCGHPLLDVGMPMAAVLLVCLILLVFHLIQLTISAYHAF